MPVSVSVILGTLTDGIRPKGKKMQILSASKERISKQMAQE